MKVSWGIALTLFVLAVGYIGAISLGFAASPFKVTDPHNLNSEVKSLASNSMARVNKPKKCRSKLLKVEIDGHTLKTDKREAFALLLKDLSSINDLDSKCEVEAFSNVLSMRWAHFSVAGEAGFSDIAKTKFADYLKLDNEYTPDILQNGTKKYQLRGVQIFVLPEQENSTFNGNPVAIECGIPEHNQKIYSTTNCTSIYQHISGLYLYYRFFRKNYEETEFINFDQKMREKLSEMIVNDLTMGEKS